MRQAAEAARKDRDAEVKADLEQTFKPQILTLAPEVPAAFWPTTKKVAFM